MSSLHPSCFFFVLSTWEGYLLSFKNSQICKGQWIPFSSSSHILFPVISSVTKSKAQNVLLHPLIWFTCSICKDSVAVLVHLLIWTLQRMMLWGHHYRLQTAATLCLENIEKSKNYCRQGFWKPSVKDANMLKNLVQPVCLAPWLLLHPIGLQIGSIMFSQTIKYCAEI